MPKEKKNHDDFARMVCLMCFRKNKNIRGISTIVKSVIEERLFSDIAHPKWEWLPKVICDGCSKLVRLLNQTPARLFEITDYSSLTPPETQPNTRSRTDQQQTCICTVCMVGRLNGGEYNSYRVLMSKAVGRPCDMEPVCMYI